MYRRIAILVVLAFYSAVATAQIDSILVSGRDTIAYSYTPITPPKRGGLMNTKSKFLRYLLDSAQDNSFNKRLDFTFVPGIYYSRSTSVGLALVAAGLYRIDKENRSLPASDFSIYAAASITGYYRVGVKGNNIFKGDARRLNYDVEFYSQPTDFWGLGYAAANSNSPMRYNGSRCMADVRFLQRVARGFYVGVGADFDYLYSRKTKKRADDYEQFLLRLNGEQPSYYALGVSLFVEYDTRDFIPNPERGVYLSLQAKVRPKPMSDVGMTTYSGRVVANYYQRLWRGAVLALDLRGELNSKGTPWAYYASLGGSHNMRGYYGGRYSDLCAVSAQLELRQRLYKRLGATAWGGAGNVFSYDNFSWRNTMPTYGVGLRFEFKRRVNLRLDYGFGGRDGRGKLIHGAVFSVNEAF